MAAGGDNERVRLTLLTGEANWAPCTVGVNTNQYGEILSPAVLHSNQVTLLDSQPTELFRIMINVLIRIICAIHPRNGL